MANEKSFMRSKVFIFEDFCKLITVKFTEFTNNLVDNTAGQSVLQDNTLAPQIERRSNTQGSCRFIC